MKSLENAIVSMVGILAVVMTSPQISLGDELKVLQGKWEMRFQDNGRNMKVIIFIQGDTETAETYDGKELVHRHEVKLQEIETEEVCVIRYGESTVTHGPRKGQKDTLPPCCLQRRRLTNTSCARP